MLTLCIAEVFLWLTLGLFFWKRKLAKRFPVIGAYLLVQVISSPLLCALLFFIFADNFKSKIISIVYLSIYWATFIASIVLLFFICIEIFRSVLAGFPGLTRIGLLIFRWAALVSVIVSLALVPYSIHSIHGRTLLVFATIFNVCLALMRPVSVLTLCLLAFLCLSMNALRLSPRDRSFGFTLGFGVLSASYLVFSLFVSKNTRMATPLQFVCEGLTLLALVIWIAYAALPEPVRKPVLIPASSTIYRWDQIASALGHKGTQIVVQQPVQGFFLTDVEKVVDRVMARNTGKRGSDL